MEKKKESSLDFSNQYNGNHIDLSKDNETIEIELRSEDVQEILTRVPHWMIRWGNIVFLVLILLLLFVSWFVKYPDMIISQAIITTKIPPQKEYAKTTGKLDAVLVEDKEWVEINQPLAILENSANFQDVFKLQSIIDTISYTHQKFYYPIDEVPILFLGDIEASYAIFENSYIQYRLNRELQPYSNDVTANQVSISELNLRLNSLKSQREINGTELEFLRKDLKRNQQLYQKGVISAQEYENKQLNYAQAERNFKNFESSISQIREGISNARRNLNGSKINRLNNEIQLLKNVIQSFNQLKKSLEEWKSLYVLKSNINGQVSFLNFWNTNQTVNQGDLVFTIIPKENSSYIAKLRTPVQNSGKLKIGQRVNLKIDNYPDTEFGIIKGSIDNISLMTDHEGFYLIEVKLPERLITSYNQEIEFKQEMIGTAEIITEDLRLIERFFYQLREVFSR